MARLPYSYENTWIPNMPNLALLLKTRSISKISLNKVISPLHTQRFKAASTHAHQYLAYQFKTLQDVPTAHTYAAVKKVVVKHIKVEHPGQHSEPLLGVSTQGLNPGVTKKLFPKSQKFIMMEWAFLSIKT